MTTYTVNSSLEVEDRAHLINTQKTIRGQKLTMRSDRIKSRLRSREGIHRSMSKTVKEHEDQKFSQWMQKHRGLENIEDQRDIARFIAYQRVKQSRQSARGIKLFSRQSSCRQRTSMERSTSRTGTVRPSETRQSSRSPSKKNTISYQIHNSLTQDRPSPIKYISDNLNIRMNQYMNLVLAKKDKDDLIIGEDQIVQVATEESTILSPMKVQYKTLANNFYRKLKRQSKTIHQTYNTLETEKGSEHLVIKLKKEMKSNHEKGLYNVKVDRQRIQSMMVTARNIEIMTQQCPKTTQTISPFSLSTARSTSRR